MSESQTTTATTAGAASGFDRVGREILTAGHDLWRAGLGALAQIAEIAKKAEIDDRKRDLFDRLVERGRPLDERRRRAMRAAAERAGKTVREAGKLLEDTVRYEVKGVLTKIGVPTREQINSLTARLETLSQKLDQLAPAPVAPASALSSPRSISKKPIHKPAAKVGRAKTQTKTR
ncbi:MAG TPA: phasin family protein [Thermoanaerobaculia bacterium]|nr:phasin family protein [Thermoanaerobaculia bacterium]